MFNCYLAIHYLQSVFNDTYGLLWFEGTFFFGIKSQICKAYNFDFHCVAKIVRHKRRSAICLPHIYLYIFYNRSTIQGCREAGAHPSCHQARGNILMTSGLQEQEWSMVPSKKACYYSSNPSEKRYMHRMWDNG